MPLTYRDGQWEQDGESLTPEQLTELRDDLVDQYAAELGQLAINELGLEHGEDPANGVTEEAAAAFVLLFMRRVTEAITSAYTIARGGVGGVTQAHWHLVVDIVVRQQTYADGFGAALQAGTVSQAQAVARARMYAGAAVEAFELGKAHRVGFAAPAYPTQGCKGGSNCRCYWSIVEFPDRFEATWKAVGDSATCEVCRQRAKDWAPFVQAKPAGVTP
jgi:hypothetical protein